MAKVQIRYPSALQSPSEFAILFVGDVPDNGPERELHLSRPLDQLKGYVGLGAKGSIFVAALEVVGRGVRFDLQGIVKPLVGVDGAYRDHPVGYLSYPSEVLMTHVSGGLTVFSVAGLVYDQSARFDRSRLGVFQHQLYPAPVDRLRLPAGLREEPLQALGLLALGSAHRSCVCQGRKRLVALLGQQETFEIAAEAFALSAVGEKIVESSGVILQRTGSGLYGLPLVTAAHLLPGPSLEHLHQPVTTNYRLVAEGPVRIGRNDRRPDNAGLTFVTVSGARTKFDRSSEGDAV